MTCADCGSRFTQISVMRRSGEFISLFFDKLLPPESLCRVCAYAWEANKRMQMASNVPFPMIIPFVKIQVCSMKF